MAKGYNEKYYVNNMTLNEYCIKNELNYYSIYRRIKKGISITDSINQSKTSPKRDKYFYKNIRLRQYCKENKIRYHMVLTLIYKGDEIGDAIKKVVSMDTPERLKMAEDRTKKILARRKKENDEAMGYKKIKLTSAEEKKADIIFSINNLRNMLKFLEKGSVDYEKGVTSIKQLQLDLKKLEVNNG